MVFCKIIAGFIRAFFSAGPTSAGSARKQDAAPLRAVKGHHVGSVATPLCSQGAGPERLTGREFSTGPHKASPSDSRRARPPLAIGQQAGRPRPRCGV